MCGICGQYNFVNGQPVETEIIKEMADTMIHRGPDDEGSFFSRNVGLGFRRLSIIDVEQGHQPMADSEQTVWVVFNGEIYNYKELREELSLRGHTFLTHSDTEVILYAFKEWGPGMLDRFNGMFGLAVWDERERTLILARDPMGIKPLYYAIRGGSLFFGSEIRAVLAGIKERAVVDPVALYLFLRYRYTPSPLTLFKGIRKLAPGEMLMVSEGKWKKVRWYNYRPVPFDPMPKDEEVEETLLAIYKRAVRRHLISDVPLGLLLSGGIDSGLLLGLMSLFGESWPTFTVGYGSSFKDDELNDAAETARLFSAKHAAVRLDQQTFIENLPKIVKHLEEPVASSSIIPMYFVSRKAREEVKVALIGQGPDELFGGYIRHLGILYGKYWRSLPPKVRLLIKNVIDGIPRKESLKRGVYSLDIDDRFERYQNVFSILPENTVNGLFQEDLLPPEVGERIWECWADLWPAMENLDELGGFQWLEVRSALPDELLMYADKMSMIHSLEVRVPYLDREVVEYVQKLDSSFKIRWGLRKYIHRRVCRKFLPQSIIQRKKRGFAVNVVDDWFRNSLNRQMEESLLDEKSLMYRYLRPTVVRRLYEEHRKGSKDNHKILFSLVVFEQWMRCMKAG